VSSTKALPIPDDAPKKRRGGRRSRKLKEQYASTDMARAVNRVAFNIPEEEVMVDGETRGLGLLSANGQSSGAVPGRVRAPAVDAKSKAKTSDKLKAKLKAIGGMTTRTPGTATSLLAPTPVMGTSTSTFALAAGMASTVGAASSHSLVSGLASSLSFTPVQGLEFVDPLEAQQKALAANERWFGKNLKYVNVAKPLDPNLNDSEYSRKRLKVNEK
jgi:U4/U6 small nuclear ribonucleoprotein PRP31